MDEDSLLKEREKKGQVKHLVSERQIMGATRGKKQGSLSSLGRRELMENQKKGLYLWGSGTGKMMERKKEKFRMK